MLYLSGVVPQAMATVLRPDLGIMAQPRSGTNLSHRLLRSRPWAADNGCFAARWNVEQWLLWLERLQDWQATCRFAVAPDVLGDAQATVLRATAYLDRMHALGYPVAFVTQDGCRSSLVPWDEIAYLFIGGTTAWKFSPPSLLLVREAQERGVPVHMGRVNTWRRLRACQASGVDSVDGTGLAFGPDVNLPQLCGWLDEVNAGQLGMAL